MKLGQCHKTVEVNNHLGFLHNKFTNGWNPEKIIINNMELSPHPILSNMSVRTDCLPFTLADSIRQFIFKVPFDNTKKILNDFDNQPLNSAYTVNQSLILNFYENRTTDPLQWVWEHYTSTIWRLAPLTLNAFIGSPIPGFITILENAIRSSNNGVFSKLMKSTWVIQRIECGSGIDIHSDKTDTRRVSFVYYLTPDFWKKADGGGLFMLDINAKKFHRINPTFNSLVMWEVNDDPRGLHYVEDVIADNNKPRIALVGFFDEC